MVLDFITEINYTDMFQLWSLAEQDLLSPDITYRLRDTGQGLNRVQAAPKTSRMMHAVLHRAQQSIGDWVGSSVIHMGDHNVPNALMFIGKSIVVQVFAERLLGHEVEINIPSFFARQIFSDIPHSVANL